MATLRICSIPGCGKTAFQKGWCSVHYNRWYRHGSPLGGGTPRGEVQRYFREVVLAYEGDKCLIWPYSRYPNGYGQIVIGGKHKIVSRLICEVINGPPPTPDHEAAHSCGNGGQGCCTKGHLSWKTHAGNMADMLVHGTSNRGETHPQAKLTEHEVREILAMKGVKSQSKIAAQFGISRENVRSIHAGITWGWL